MKFKYHKKSNQKKYQTFKNLKIQNKHQLKHYLTKDFKKNKMFYNNKKIYLKRKMTQNLLIKLRNKKSQCK